MSKMKIKDLKIKNWPEKRDLTIKVPSYFEGKSRGFNQALDLINNLEFNLTEHIELDEEKIVEELQKVLLPMKRKRTIGKLSFEEVTNNQKWNEGYSECEKDYQKEYYKYLAQAIVDSKKDIIKEIEE